MDKSNLIVIKDYQYDLNLTKNFKLSEFFCTNQAFPYPVDMLVNHQLILLNIIQNDGLVQVANNIISLAEFLQSFRDEFNEAITINSGFRSTDLNRAVNGVKYSKHLIGCAADIYFKGYQLYTNCPKNRHTPSKIIAMCDWLRVMKSKKVLSELVFHDNYIHLAIFPPHEKSSRDC